MTEYRQQRIALKLSNRYTVHEHIPDLVIDLLFSSPIVVDKVWRNLHDVLDVEVDCHVLDEEQSDAWKDGVFKCIRRTACKVARVS